MKITLYKNCILTNSYSEVFDTFHKDSNGKTSLERYLATLSKLEIDAGEVYYTNGGKISFDIFNIGYDNVDFYTFNYMKFENEDATFARYCFIDMITVVNNIAVVSYIEDIWSCYAKTMKMRKSLLTRSRIIDYGDWQIPFYAPGMTYESNNFANIVPFETLDTIPAVNVVAQIQLYKLAQEGTINERLVIECAMLSKASTFDKKYIMYLSNALLDLQSIMTNSSSKTVQYSGEEYHFEIYNIMLLPYKLNVINDNSFLGEGVDITYDTNTIFRPLNILEQKKKICKEYNLPINYKRCKIGLYTTVYDCVENGTPIPIRITSQAGLTDLSIYLEFQNQIIDITKNFTVNIPISVQTADITQQQATTRELAIFNSKIANQQAQLQIFNGSMQAITGMFNVGTGIATGDMSSIGKGFSQVTSGASSIAGGAINMKSANKQLEIANRSMFTTNKGIQADPNATINAVYGLIALEVNADNEVEVQANIDNVGYVCNEVVDDLLSTITTGMENKYNVMQFDYVNIYGAFTQSIADALRDILYGGFKIWYDETGVNE